MPIAADRPIAAAMIQFPSTLPDGSSTVDQGRAASPRRGPITGEHHGSDGLSVSAADQEYLRRVLPV